MRLLLLRHAKAEKAGPEMRDRDRRLTARGRQDAAQIAAYMQSRSYVPDRVLVSGAERTRETWKCMTPVLSTNIPVAYDDRLYEAGPEAIMGVIKAEGSAAAVLLVVGHNPGLHDTARLLTTAADAVRLPDDLPTAGLLVIDFAGRDWLALSARSGRLADFATPRRVEAESE
jgi:phosphohistidine phosphatase